MTAITRYPVVADHDALYRGDPQSIGVRVTTNTGTVEAPVLVPRALAGTFWRAHVRDSEDGALLCKWTVVVLEDEIGAGPSDVGWLAMSMDDVTARALVDGCMWDLEQVTNAADDATTHSLGTFWKVRAATVIEDVSHG
jgi:hypothetical protein